MKKKKKIISFIKNNKVVFITFILSLFTILYVYTVNNVTPFGDKSLLCVDFYHQYGPMMYELVYRLTGGGGLIYSFFQGLGLPFFRNFMNYLSSPFNLILLLFTKPNILKGISFVIGLKAVVASSTMAYYLKTKFKDNNVFFIPIAILYGFSAYFRSYYWNLMWLDGMIWLPIIVLGIENIVNQKKWRLYTISLAIMLFSNYFIGYMICIFSVIYYIIYLLYKFDFKEKNKLKRLLSNVGIYASSSLLAGALVAVFLIPMGGALLSTSATGSEMPNSQYYSFELIDFLKAHLSCVDNVTFKSDPINSPNISAGILSVFMFFTYLANVRIPKRNKICYLALFAIITSFFFIPQLDFVIQAFHVPNDLPYRYSFIYTFVFLLLGTYGLINFTKESFIKNVLVFAYTIGFIFICMIDPWENTTTNMLYINVILLVLFFLFFILGKIFKNFRSIFFISLSFVAVIDAIESINYAWDITQVEENFVTTTKDIDNTINYISKIDNSAFYRIDHNEGHTLNDSSKSFYNGVTAFSSMEYEGLAKLQMHLGLEGNNINSFEYKQQTPVYDTMFNIKYVLGNTEDKVRYEQVKAELNKKFYRYNYTSGLAFGVNNELLNWNYSNDSSLENQIDFVNKSTDINDVLTKLDYISKNKLENEKSITAYNYEYINPGDNLYFEWDDSAISFIIVNGTLYSSDDKYENLDSLTYNNYQEYHHGQIKTFKSREQIISIVIGFNYLSEDSLQLYAINNDKFNEFYKKINNNSLTITKYDESYVKGQMYLDEDQFVYTSIPYDKGWSVYVDGKKTDTFSLADALLAFNATKGQHEIEFKYSIPGFKTGLVISLISLCILVSTKYIKHIEIKPRRSKKRKKA